MAGASILMAAAMMTLAGSEWSPSDGGDRFVQFGEEGRVAGSGGCNRFSGSYTQEGDAVHIGPLMSTRMACADAAMMEKEQAWFAMLEKARHVEATTKRLVLKDASGQEIAVLVRRDWD